MGTTERTAMIITAATALLTLTLSLLYRFTDLPLWPRRRRGSERPAVDWGSAPDLPAYSYAALYELAVRRRDALARAVRCARDAGLPVPEPLTVNLVETRGQDGPQEGAYAALALSAADDFLEDCLPPDTVPTAEQLAEFEQRAGRPYDRRAEEGIALTDVVGSLEVSRIGMQALACLTEGTALTLDRPCFHHPLHARGTERVLCPPEACTAESPEDALVDDDFVTVCRNCADGTPAPLLVWTQAGEVPYYRTEFETKAVFRTSGYGAAALEWDADDLLRAFVEWPTFEVDHGDGNGNGNGDGDDNDRTEATA
ncbi:hypothetical protein H9Y04_07755 [Streptomyces sp. TRM66268-LWL]|uniref:Uncharacterized protein n=1 Tax=Streptomyces polyasparticus TaxID=2767826 RepID=A0ABR7SDA3_9ACTN|nr:hypothetical protein [Streptomyces polyasparticus]MBC9712466.1 hypothetical protein [Streptomyces polyasparticus]